MSSAAKEPGRSQWEGWTRYLWLSALALLLLLGVAWSALSAGAQLKRTLVQVTRLQNANKELAVLMQHVVDLETGQRGYMLTRDEKYLQPYTTAELLVDGQIRKVGDLLDDLRELRTDFQGIRENVGKKRDEMSATLAIHRQQGPEAALALLRSGFGRQAMDTVRQAITGLSLKLRMRIAQRQDELAEVIALRNLGIIASLGLAIAASVAGMVLLRRHLAALRSEERLREEADRSRAASNEKSIFLANMSHEIRTPMNAIFGFSELLAERITDAQDKRYVDAIVSSGRSLLTLINDVLDLSKVEAGKLDVRPAPMNLQEMIDSIAMVFGQMALEKGLSIRIEIDPRVPDGLCLDHGRLRQMLFNLVGNSLKYTDKGHITVRARVEPNDGDETRIDCVIEVEDTGIGIANSDTERIFDPFTQIHDADNYREGSGLGLSITRRLAQLMNGTVTVDSRLGAGSIFRIHLAAVPVTPRPESITAPQGRLSELPQCLILVVDDIALNRQLVEAMFRGSHHRVIEAHDGLQAVQMAKTHHPDVILMDIRMPGLDGVSAMQQIRGIADLRRIPIVAATASSLHGEELTLRERFDGYIRKPLSQAILYAELQRILTDHPPAPTVATIGELLHPQEWKAVCTRLRDLENSTWQQLSTTMALRESVRLAEQLDRLAARCGAAALSEYAARLHQAAEQCDPVALEGALAEYPRLLSQLDARYSEPA